MIAKLLQWSGYVMVAVLVWTVWKGPLRDVWAPASADSVAVWQKQMSDCMKGERYKAGAGGMVAGSPEEVCSQRLGFYQEDGTWYRADRPRPR